MKGKPFLIAEFSFSNVGDGCSRLCILSILLLSSTLHPRHANTDCSDPDARNGCF
jgi:hypothetical protein